MSDKSFVVSATVVTEDGNEAVRAAEVLARAAAGLLLEGIYVQVAMSQSSGEEETPDA